MSDFPQTLRNWRQNRRFSQLDLALEADVSARHISFLETGRAKPSREMALRLAEALHLPLSAQNLLLTHAGYAARYDKRGWDHAEMDPIRAAIAHTLERHAPYPAFALDRDWRLMRLNAPAQKLYGQFGLSEGASLLELMMSDTLPQLVENWGEVAHHTVLRLRTESTALGGVPLLDQAAAHLAQVPRKGDAPAGAVVPLVLNLGAVRLSMFGTIAQFGTPEDVALDAFKIEQFFPSDAASKAFLEAL